MKILKSDFIIYGEPKQPMISDEDHIASERLHESIFEHLDKHEYDTALQLIVEYLENYNPSNDELIVYYLGCLTHLGHSEEGLPIVSQLLAVSSPYDSIYYAPAQQFLAHIHTTHFSDSSFLKYYQQLCEETDRLPENERKYWPYVIAAFVTLLVKGEKGSQAALDLLNKAWEVADELYTNYLVHFTNGLALAHLGRVDEGIEAFEEMYDPDDFISAIPHLDMANICSTGGSIYLAQQYYKKVEECPDYTDDMAASIGDYFCTFGLHKYTAYWYAKVQDEEIRAEILPALAYAYYKLGDPQLLDTLREAIEIDPLATQEAFKTEFTVADATELLNKVTN